MRLDAFDRCSRDGLLLLSPELFGLFGLSGERGVVDVSPDECLNSTDDTKRKRGVCIFHELCRCSDIEWVRCGTIVVSDELPVDGITIVDEPSPAVFELVVAPSGLCVSLMVSLLNAEPGASSSENRQHIRTHGSFVGLQWAGAVRLTI